MVQWYFSLLVFPSLTSKSDLRGITKCDQIHNIDWNEFDHTKVAAFVQPSGLWNPRFQLGSAPFFQAAFTAIEFRPEMVPAVVDVAIDVELKSFESTDILYK